VTLTTESRLEDYIAKHGLTSSVRDDSLWAYVNATTDWSYKGRWETGGDWTRNLIDHPDRGHPYGGWGWPELKKPADHTPWVIGRLDGRRDLRQAGHDARSATSDDGKPVLRTLDLPHLGCARTARLRGW
jgi:hypothetical protein